MQVDRQNTTRDLHLEQRRLDSLKRNPRNARTHSKRQIRAIAESIKTFGFTNPVLIDSTGTILAGHGRYEAGRLLGLTEVPTIQISDLTEGQKRAFVLADNKLAERAGWDREILAIELGELSVLLPELGLSVDLTGFEAPEIDLFIADIEDQKTESREDEIVPAPANSVSRPGDLWVLGRHRVLCGDVRDSAAFARLLGGERADMVFTEPPYTVPVDRNVMGNGHLGFALASGEMSSQEFADFLRKVLSAAVGVSCNGALHYVCMDWRQIDALLEAGKLIYGDLEGLCVWDKNKADQGSLYRSQHQLIAVFKVGTADQINNGEPGLRARNRSNVWRYAGVKISKAGRDEELASHPAVKPVGLVADAIKDVTRQNAIILDLFGCRGTTLIAAERTGRCARLVETDPHSVDVTIQRFQNLTKADAIHGESGLTFTAMAARAKQAA